MRRSSATRAARLGAALLTAAVSLSLVSFYPGTTARAGEDKFRKTKENTRIDCSEVQQGNILFFGNYNEKPIDFYVIKASTSEFGGTSMFLRSREALYKRKFDNNGCHNVWKDSSRFLYSDLYLDLNYRFIKEAFTPSEINSIISSVKKGGVEYKADFTKFVFEKTNALEGDKIFILSYLEHGGTSPQKRVWNDDGDYITYKKSSGESQSFLFDFNSSSVKNGNGVWLRDRDLTSSKRVGVYYYSLDGSPNDPGLITDNTDLELGVEPALNIDIYSILFYTNINSKVDFGTKRKVTTYVDTDKNGNMFYKRVLEEVGAEYKLTLKDKNIDLSIPSGEAVSADRNIITVPYEIKGSNADSVNQMSVMILEDKLKDLNENKNNIKYYEPLENCYSERDGSFIKNGTATIKLPPKYDIDKWGNDYHIYLLAEDVNGAYETDYAAYMEVPKIESDQLDDGADYNVLTPTPTADPRLSNSTNSGATPASNGIVNSNRSSDQQSGSRKNATPTSAANSNSIKSGSIKINKSRADVICGKTLSLRLTGDETYSNVVWKSSDEKIASVDSNGTVKGKKAGTATITAKVNEKKVTCALTVLYKDVTDSSKFWYEPTNELTAKEVVKGYDNQTKFKPANKCTRAQMVTFIWRLMGEPAPKTTKCKFKDVKQSDYFYKACIWGNEKGIVEGYKNGTFGPQIVCARRHAVTFLWRLAGKPAPNSKTNKFSDVKKTDYFYTATQWASEKNILAGYKDGTFRPNGDCLRRQMVTFLYKYDEFINKNVK